MISMGAGGLPAWFVGLCEAERGCAWANEVSLAKTFLSVPELQGLLLSCWCAAPSCRSWSSVLQGKNVLTDSLFTFRVWLVLSGL